MPTLKLNVCKLCPGRKLPAPFQFFQFFFLHCICIIIISLIKFYFGILKLQYYDQGMKIWPMCIKNVIGYTCPFILMWAVSGEVRIIIYRKWCSHSQPSLSSMQCILSRGRGGRTTFSLSDFFCILVINNTSLKSRTTSS